MEAPGNGLRPWSNTANHMHDNHDKINSWVSFPGDLVTSLRETGEKILLPYPTRQPARSRMFAFAVNARVIKC